MNREEIYDHLAQVYLGKRKKADNKSKQKYNAWLFINIVTALVIFASVFYGLNAFLHQRRSSLKSNIILSLHNGPVNLAYDFRNPTVPTKSFSLSTYGIDASKYNNIEFSVRAVNAMSAGIVKVEFRNTLNEKSYYYIQGVGDDWEKYKISLDKFKQITDWSNIVDVAFIVESWNVDGLKGNILIDDICFSGNKTN